MAVARARTHESRLLGSGKSRVGLDRITDSIQTTYQVSEVPTTDVNLFISARHGRLLWQSCFAKPFCKFGKILRSSQGIPILNVGDAKFGVKLVQECNCFPCVRKPIGEGAARSDNA